MPRSAVGIDVGANTVWLVSLDVDEPEGGIRTLLSSPVDPAAIVNFCRAAACVAIDAPAAPSDRPHADDVRLSAKFRAARCGEVALRRGGIAVAWVTPARTAVPPPWIATGYAVWQALESAGIRCVETYPHGIFWRLTGQPLLHKQQPAGHLRRIDALRPLLPELANLEMWSHDGLDAMAAALLARLVVAGEAVSFDCSHDVDWATHDGSVIWLPASPPFGGDKVEAE